MGERRTAEILISIEQEIRFAREEVADANLKLDHIEDEMSRARLEARPLSEFDAEKMYPEENSAEIKIPGLGGGYLTKEAWDRYSPALKLFFLSMLMTGFGWFAKTFHFAFTGGK